MKSILLSLLLSSFVFADYIPDSNKYSLLPDGKGYMSLVKQAYKDKAYTKEELSQALASEDVYPLSDLFRTAAYDEVRDYNGLSNFSKNIIPTKDLLEKYPPFALLLADIYLRIGEYNKVLLLLPREDIVLLPLKLKNKAYYYRGMSKYLYDGEVSGEFKIIKNHFEVTRDIFYKMKKVKR